MCHFEIMSKKHWIWAVLGKNGPILPFLAKKGQFWIFDKKVKRPSFFYIHKSKAWEKSEKSDVSLRKYEQKTLILGWLDHWTDWTIFGQKGPILNFRSKSETVTFLQLRSHSFMRKIRKIWWADFSENPYGRTYGRTDGRTSVNP